MKQWHSVCMFLIVLMMVTGCVGYPLEPFAEPPTTVTHTPTSDPDFSMTQEHAVHMDATVYPMPSAIPTLRPTRRSVEEPEIRIATPTAAPTETPYPTPEATLAPLTNGALTVLSVSSQGVQGNGNSWELAMSDDGSCVAFTSEATNLVTLDTNRYPDVFVRDMGTGKTERVSVASNGQQSNGYSRNPSVSADCRYVAFASQATNLVDQPINTRGNVFVHDRETGETTLVSVPMSEGEVQNFGAECPSISADGRFVAFASPARNLSENYTNETTSRSVDQAYVYDRITDTMQLVSFAPEGQTVEPEHAGLPAISDVTCPIISGDGSRIAFAASAPSLRVGAATYAIFLYDTESHHSTYLDIFALTQDLKLSQRCEFPTLSHDGTQVAFRCGRKRLVIYNTETGLTEQVFEGEEELHDFAFSADGQFLVFWEGQLRGGARSVEDWWKLHRLNVETATMDTLPITNEDGLMAHDEAVFPAISKHGNLVAFVSIKTDLVEEQREGFSDIFLYQMP